MPRSHTHRLRVRYSDCDPQGHVFNANYFTYFDIALTELWRAAIGSYTVMVDAGTDMVVREATARFHASANFDDEVDVEISVADLGTTSMVTEMRVSRGQQLLVDGRMVHVFVDVSTKGKTPIPDAIRQALTAPSAAPHA
jgi:acyl-CoA thioester hydrolase